MSILTIFDYYYPLLLYKHNNNYIPNEINKIIFSFLVEEIKQTLIKNTIEKKITFFANPTPYKNYDIFIDKYDDFIIHINELPYKTTDKFIRKTVIELLDKHVYSKTYNFSHMCCGNKGFVFQSMDYFDSLIYKRT